MAIPENLKSNIITKYFSEAKAELEKVTWPTRKDLINHTILVIGISLVVAIFIGVADFLLTIGVDLLLK